MDRGLREQIKKTKDIVSTKNTSEHFQVYFQQLKIMELPVNIDNTERIISFKILEKTNSLNIFSHKETLDVVIN